jgi:hypothetical protein
MRVNLRAMILRGSAGSVCHLENEIRPLVTEYTLTIKQILPTRLILMRTSVTRGLILIFKIYD